MYAIFLDATLRKDIIRFSVFAKTRQHQFINIAASLYPVSTIESVEVSITTIHVQFIDRYVVVYCLCNAEKTTFAIAGFIVRSLTVLEDVRIVRYVLVVIQCFHDIHLISDEYVPANNKEVCIYVVFLCQHHQGFHHVVVAERVLELFKQSILCFIYGITAHNVPISIIYVAFFEIAIKVCIIRSSVV